MLERLSQPAGQSRAAMVPRRSAWLRATPRASVQGVQHAAPHHGQDGDSHPLQAGEACSELLADPPPTRLGLLRRAVIAGLERRFAIVADERHRYEEAGAIGPIYHRNSMQQQLQLMERIRALKEGAPMTRAISTLVVALGGALTLVLGACGGGGTDQEDPAPRPPANCQAKPEACK